MGRQTGVSIVCIRGRKIIWWPARWPPTLWRPASWPLTLEISLGDFHRRHLEASRLRNFEAMQINRSKSCFPSGVGNIFFETSGSNDQNGTINTPRVIRWSRWCRNAEMWRFHRFLNNPCKAQQKPQSTKRSKPLGRPISSHLAAQIIDLLPQSVLRTSTS